MVPLEINYSISLSEILVAGLLLISSGLGYVVKRQHDQIKEIKLRLSDRKHDLYLKMYNLIFDLVKGQKSNKTKTASEEIMADNIIEIKKELLLYAPDNVVKQFIIWNRYNNNNPGSSDHFKYFLKAMLLLRKDMGNSKTEIKEIDYLYMIMGTDEGVEEMAKILQI